MRVSLKSTNHYEIKNGKLTPKVHPLQPSVNYRYIPYSPINKPNQQDYFRATIDQLLEENAELKKRITGNDGLQESYSSPNFGGIQNYNSSGLEEELYMIQNKTVQLQNELSENKKIMLAKDMKINELQRKNQQLTDKVLGLGQQLKGLKLKLNQSQNQSRKISKVLESFSGTIEKVSQLENALSENPQLSERLSGGSFKKINHYHHYPNDDFHSDEYDDRFMTPRQKIHDLKPNANKNRSAEQKEKSYRLYSQGPALHKIKQTTETWKETGSEYNESNSDSEEVHKIPHEIVDKMWAQKNRMDYQDPVAGTFSPLFTRNRN